MGVVIVVVIVDIVVVVTRENKVNSYSDQLKLGQVCKFGVEFDKMGFDLSAIQSCFIF